MTGDVVVVQDLSTFGLGLDIAGGWLVAQGLLISPHDITAVSGSFFGFNPSQMRARLHDRVSGQIGIVALIAGFVFQGAGYVVALRAGPSDRTTWASGLVAIALALVQRCPEPDPVVNHQRV